MEQLAGTHGFLLGFKLVEFLLILPGPVGRIIRVKIFGV